MIKKCIVALNDDQNLWLLNVLFFHMVDNPGMIFYLL